MKKILVITLVLALIAGAVYAQSRGRVQKDDMVYKGRSLFMGDSANSQHGLILHEGTGGTTKFAIENDGKMSYYTLKPRYVSMSSTSTYSLSSNCNYYIFDLAVVAKPYAQVIGDSVIGGVSVFLPAGSAALDGWVLNIVNATTDAGTTDIILVPAGAKLGNSVTDHILTTAGATYWVNSTTARAYDIADVRGESITLIYRWVSSGGTWYQTEIH